LTIWTKLIFRIIIITINSFATRPNHPLLETDDAMIDGWSYRRIATAETQQRLHPFHQ
jgi:hypothetical protein